MKTRCRVFGVTALSLFRVLEASCRDDSPSPSGEYPIRLDGERIGEESIASRVDRAGGGLEVVLVRLKSGAGVWP